MFPLINQVDAIIDSSSFAESDMLGGHSFVANPINQSLTNKNLRDIDYGTQGDPSPLDSSNLQRANSFNYNINGITLDDGRGSVVSSTSTSMGIRKDPNLEFFQMLLLSYKMNNQDLEEVMELDHREMYLKCTKDEKVTFFHFPDWIAKEINKIRFRKVYHQNKKRLARNTRLLNKLEAMDGIKFVTNVRI